MRDASSSVLSQDCLAILFFQLYELLLQIKPYVDLQQETEPIEVCWLYSAHFIPAYSVPHPIAL